MFLITKNWSHNKPEKSTGRYFIVDVIDLDFIKRLHTLNEEALLQAMLSAHM